MQKKNTVKISRGKQKCIEQKEINKNRDASRDHEK